MLVTKSKVWSGKGSRLPGGPNTKDVFGAGCTKSDALKKLMLNPMTCAAHLLRVRTAVPRPAFWLHTLNACSTTGS